MESIQQAIADAMRFMAELEAGEHAGQVKEKVSEFFNNDVTARGFMAALGTGNAQLSPEANQGLLDGLRANHEIAYDLLVKNIIMSSSAAVTHEENKETDLRVSSESVTARCVEIANQLHDANLSKKVEEVLGAIHQYETDPKSKGDSHAIWFNFFERWGYEGRHVSAAKPHVMSILSRFEK
jgi:hypothetical protein